MKCPQSQTDLNGYLDGELSLSESMAFERHLADCADCQAIHASGLAIRQAMSDGSFHFRAPQSLLDRIDETVRSDKVADSPGATGRGTPRPVRDARQTWWLGIAAIAACLLLGLFLWLPARPAADDLIAQEIVSGHIRSMMADHLTDVPSLDRHTVKPWFDGKLDFAPPVVDLSTKGFPLIGGRLDYVQNRSVAALVYKRQQHVINLFVWVSADATTLNSKVLVRQGYNLVRWNESGMTFWAVSDLEMTELQQFAQGIQNPG